MPWLADLVTLCEAADAGTFNVDLFTSLSSEVPVLASGVATIVAYPGGPPERTQNSVAIPGYINVRAQLMIRAKTAELAELKARKLYMAITGVRNTFINSGWYREITALQEPYELPVDDRKQRRFVFNVKGIKRPEVVA